MNKWQAVQSFWESFSLPAVDENSVTDGMTMPYITYSTATGSMDDPILMTASLWYRSMSWKDISQKADEIARRIGERLCISKLTNGYLWIRPGSPFAQRMSDEDPHIRRILINIDAEYLTAY